MEIEAASREGSVMVVALEFLLIGLEILSAAEWQKIAWAMRQIILA
jgi:hypothetical protein